MRTDRRGFLTFATMAVLGPWLAPGRTITTTTMPPPTPSIVPVFHPAWGGHDMIWMNQAQMNKYLEFVNAETVKAFVVPPHLLRPSHQWDAETIHDLRRTPALWRRYPHA